MINENKPMGGKFQLRKTSDFGLRPLTQQMPRVKLKVFFDVRAPVFPAVTPGKFSILERAVQFLQNSEK